MFLIIICGANIGIKIIFAKNNPIKIKYLLNCFEYYTPQTIPQKKKSSQSIIEMTTPRLVSIGGLMEELKTF